MYTKINVSIECVGAIKLVYEVLTSAAVNKKVALLNK